MKKNTNKLSIFLLCMGFLLVTFATNLTFAQPPLPSFQDDVGSDDEPEPGDTKKKKGKKKKKAKKKKKKKKKNNDDDYDDADDGGGDTTADAGSNDAGVADNAPEKRAEPARDASERAVADAGASEKTPDSAARDAVDGGAGATADQSGDSPADSQPSDQATPEGSSDGAATGSTAPTDPTTGTSQVTNEVVMLTPQAQLFWELRFVWLVVALLLLSWILLLFHSLLPLQGLRFLSMGSHGLLRLGAAILFLVLLYRMLKTASLPGSSQYTGLLLFSFVALETHIQKKKSFPTVYFGAFALLPIAIGGMLWALAQPIAVDAALMGPAQQSSYYSWGLTLMYVAFGVLATAGAWLFASGYLGLLAKRHKGTGYGLDPEAWNQLQLQPGVMTLIAFPILTLAWIFQVVWSLDAFGSAWKAWTIMPRLWAVMFCWLFVAAYLFSMRFPRRSADLDAPLIYGDSAVQPTNRFPSFLLLIATVGSAALYVGAHYIVALMQ